MGTRPNTVKTQLRGALAKLRRAMDDGAGARPAPVEARHA
jgi:hypothetical protein